MSNEDDSSGRDWGTIFTRTGEHALGAVERERSTAWTPADEAAYLERVKERAMAKAVEILDNAKAEAQAIKQRARQEGYEQGVAESERELEEFRAGMAESVAAVLSTIEGQCSHIFDQWREDLVAVARLAVEKATAAVLSEDRGAMLAALLNEAVGLLEQRRELTIRVNAQDEPVISDIINLAKERYPDVQAWKVKADHSITPGGMLVESASSLADGRLESRLAAVEEVLKTLMLPSS